MLNVGFTGSREQYWENRPHRPYKVVRSVIYSLLDHENIHIHVGDATGVDKCVVELSCLFFPITVYGVNGKWRNVPNKVSLLEVASSDVYFHDTQYSNWKQAYAIRDKAMVDNCDMLYAIWDGTSRGTRLTFEYAIEQGKRVHVAEWKTDKFEWTSYN